jgi:hypothetical protein
VHAHCSGTTLRGLTSPHSAGLNETSWHGGKKCDSYNYRYNKPDVDNMRAAYVLKTRGQMADKLQVEVIFKKTNLVAERKKKKKSKSFV